MCIEQCKSLFELCTEFLFNEKEKEVHKPEYAIYYGRRAFRRVRVATGTSALHFFMNRKEIHVTVVLDSYLCPSYGGTLDDTRSQVAFYSVVYNRNTHVLTGSLGKYRDLLQSYIESVLLLIKMELVEDTYEVLVLDSLSNMVGLAKFADRSRQKRHKKRTP